MRGWEDRRLVTGTTRPKSGEGTVVTFNKTVMYGDKVNEVNKDTSMIALDDILHYSQDSKMKKEIQYKLGASDVSNLVVLHKDLGPSCGIDPESGGSVSVIWMMKGVWYPYDEVEVTKNIIAWRKGTNARRKKSTYLNTYFERWSLAVNTNTMMKP